LIFLLMVNLIDNRRRLDSIMKLVVIAGTMIAVFAINDFVSGNFATKNRQIGIRIAGIVGGVFGNPNDLATSLDLLIPISVALALTRKGAARVFYFICAGVLSIGVISTFSRGGFLGLVVIGGVLLWKLGRRRRGLAVGIFTGLLLLFLLARSYSGRMFTIVDTDSDTTGSAQARIDLLERAASLAVMHPLLGIGIGNFHIYSIHEQRAHNSYLEISAEL